MSREEMVIDSKREGRGRTAKLVTMLLAAAIVLLSAGILGEISQHAYAQSLISLIFDFGLSPLRVTLILGFGGTMLSIPFLARRTRPKNNLQ